jgi:hypothetical protein
LTGARASGVVSGIFGKTGFPDSSAITGVVEITTNASSPAGTLVWLIRVMAYKENSELSPRKRAKPFLLPCEIVGRQTQDWFRSWYNLMSSTADWEFVIYDEGISNSSRIPGMNGHPAKVISTYW